MEEITDSIALEKELTRIYNRFNHHFWEDELPEVIITFKPTKSAYGHMTTAPVWISDLPNNNSKYELNVDAYTINRSPEEICATILHEQCHLYCRIKNIRETSNNHRYHNEEFKKVAEEHGLECEKSEKWGWTNTTLAHDAQQYCKKIKVKKISYHFIKIKPKKRTLTRYQCPCCKVTTAWVSSTQFLICGQCNTRLIETPSPKKNQ